MYPVSYRLAKFRTNSLRKDIYVGRLLSDLDLIIDRMPLAYRIYSDLDALISSQIMLLARTALNYLYKTI